MFRAREVKSRYMQQLGQMRVFGLTGGIASGKSSVAAHWRSRGLPVLDADALARDVVAPGSEGLTELVREFGADVLREGKLDRKQLGRRVFADPERLRRLEEITHPRIQALRLEQLAQLEAAGHPLALQSCLQVARRGAVVVQVGTLPPTVEFPANALMVRELDYRGAFRAEREFDLAVQAIRSRRIDVRPLITAQIPLPRAHEAFELALDRTRSTKVQLVASD